jgi:two-component system sensor histidine kinase QseC
VSFRSRGGEVRPEGERRPVSPPAREPDVACLPTRSIRARLVASILIAMVAILGLSAVGSYEVVKHESEELFGARLATSARVLEAMVAPAVEDATLTAPLVIALPKELEQAAGEYGSALGHPYETKIAFQVWRDDGTLLVRSASAPTDPFSPNVPGFSTRQVNGELCHVFVLQSGNTWVHVAEKNEVRDELLHDLGIAVMAPLVCGALLLLVLVNALVLYGLAPLRQLAASIQTREPESLGPIELTQVPAEVRGVVGALNDLLRRVALAFDRERRFTDAAAHELRTPIAALKIHAENVARADNERDRAHSIARLMQALERTAKLADQMLAYSRTQNAADDEPRVPVDLRAVVRDAVMQLEPLRLRKSQRITLEAGAADTRIMGDPVKLLRLVFNLLDNASRYAPEQSTIRVALERQGAWVRLSISNAGAPIPPELRERVFEPYYRVPGSASEGSGLGLAIVKEVAAQHGASVRLEPLHESGGTTVKVAFPAVEPVTENAVQH